MTASIVFLWSIVSENITKWVILFHLKKISEGRINRAIIAWNNNASADDGNVVECVMLLAPGLLGCGSVEDLAHILQLKEAKKISCNITPEAGVIYTNGRMEAQILIENA